MGMTNDDSVKQKLLDSLAEEPTMVVSTAYIYAKNFVEYGADVTRAWITAVEQASIIEKISIKAHSEAYDSFKKEYENRLNADLVAILEDLDLQIDELSFSDEEPINITQDYIDEVRSWEYAKKGCKKLIQQKINNLKAESEGKG